MLVQSNIFGTAVLLNLVLMGNCDQNTDQQKRTNVEIRDQDITDTFKIEGTDQGMQRVNLKCGSDSMNVVLETEKPFSGVMYTRGSFYKQGAPCFVKPIQTNARKVEINFQLDQCQTVKEGELYSNVVVIQNDPELITPGDSAFSLECDFRQPRNIDVEANMKTRDRNTIGSRITRTIPDSTIINYIAKNSTDLIEHPPNRTLENDFHAKDEL